jgi:hypothetical protein
MIVSENVFVSYKPPDIKRPSHPSFNRTNIRIVAIFVNDSGQDEMLLRSKRCTAGVLFWQGERKIPWQRYWQYLRASFMENFVCWRMSIIYNCRSSREFETLVSLLIGRLVNYSRNISAHLQCRTLSERSNIICEMLGNPFHSGCRSSTFRYGAIHSIRLVSRRLQHPYGRVPQLPREYSDQEARDCSYAAVIRIEKCSGTTNPSVDKDWESGVFFYECLVANVFLLAAYAVLKRL